MERNTIRNFYCQKCNAMVSTFDPSTQLCDECSTINITISIKDLDRIVEALSNQEIDCERIYQISKDQEQKKQAETFKELNNRLWNIQVGIEHNLYKENKISNIIKYKNY